MLWITDAVVVDTFAGRSLVPWSAFVAWVAILIDYLELPVILDTLRKVYQQRLEIRTRVRYNLLHRDHRGGHPLPLGAAA